MKAPALGSRGQLFAAHGADSGGRTIRLLLPNHAAHFIQAGLEQFLGVERCSAGEQFIKQHAQAVNVAARIDIEAGYFRLLRTHVSRCADELLERREDCLISQALVGGGFGDAKIDNLRHRRAVIDGNENV